MSLSLDDAAARIGGFCWVERRLFEVMGRGVGALSRPEAKVMVDRHAAHAAWRAGQWWERLPVLAVVDRDALVAAPSPRQAAVFDVLGGDGLGGDGLGEAGWLAGVYRVALPRLAGAYAAFAPLTSPPADGPARRTLAQAEFDIGADWREGESFVHSLLVSIEAVDAAADAVARLERLLV